MNIVSVHELTKIYETGMRKGGITALDTVSLGVESGEIFGLLGPNGAGKTTLMKIILGITQLTAGSVFLFGLPPENPESRRRVGYLPENHRFPDHLTGMGLLQLTARMHRLDGPEMQKKAEDLLRLVGLDRWGTTKIRKYSKGMLQRVGLAQALVPDPDLLLLDEPTDGVDPVGKAEIKDVLKKVRDEGKSIILNSHLLSEVEAVADRVAILSRGKVVRTGSVTELTSRHAQYEVEAAFGDKLLEIPEELGKRISLSTGRMLLELKEEKFINDIIDMLRVRKISIKSVKPIKITLEQSFMETVGEKKNDDSGAIQI